MSPYPSCKRTHTTQASLQENADTHPGIGAVIMHTITCLINPDATTPIATWAPGEPERPP